MNIMMTSKRQNSQDLGNSKYVHVSFQSSQQLNNMCKAISTDKKKEKNVFLLQTNRGAWSGISSGTLFCTETISAMILSHEISSFIPDDIPKSHSSNTVNLEKSLTDAMFYHTSTFSSDDQHWPMDTEAKGLYNDKHWTKLIITQANDWCWLMEPCFIL